MLLAANASDTNLSIIPPRPQPEAEVYAKDFALTQDYDVDMRKFLSQEPITDVTPETNRGNKSMTGPFREQSVPNSWSTRQWMPSVIPRDEPAPKIPESA